MRQGIARLDDAAPRLGQIPLGGTATGTGLNTHPDFAKHVRALLSEQTGLTISPPADPFEAQAARDALVETSGALKVVAVSLTKIANDLRLMGSGPRAGLAEIFLPELQKGSSIMPGKVNPVIPEVVTQVGAQVIGNDAAITVGGMSGQFELNVYVPLMARNLLQSISLLASASRLSRRSAWTGSRRTASSSSATPSSRSRPRRRSTRTSGTTRAPRSSPRRPDRPLAPRRRARRRRGRCDPRRGARLPRMAKPHE